MAASLGKTTTIWAEHDFLSREAQQRHVPGTGAESNSGTKTLAGRGETLNTVNLRPWGGLKRKGKGVSDFENNEA